MSFLRRSIFATLFVYFLLTAGLAFGVLWNLQHFTELDPEITTAISLAFALLLSFSLIYFDLHLPLKKIVHEMKAMLTGKPYRRIFTLKTNELGVLAHFFNEVTRNLESISGNVKTHARIQKELDSAQDIQRLLLPKMAPNMPGLKITAKTRPASEIGGDTFDFFNKNDRILMYIGDSTGHGIPAALVMVMVDVLLETFIEIESSLSNILIRLNQYLKPHLKPSMFMTMILMEWIPSEKKIIWVGGGHEHIIHVRTRRGEVDVIKAGGLAVGMLADNSKFVKQSEIQLEEDDFIVLYSDGIIEAKNVTGELYSLKRLSDFLKSQASSTVNTELLFEKIAVDVGRFMEGQNQLDDMTLIVMKHSLKEETEDHSTEWKSS